MWAGLLGQAIWHAWLTHWVWRSCAIDLLLLGHLFIGLRGGFEHGTCLRGGGGHDLTIWLGSRFLRLRLRRPWLARGARQIAWGSG
jgi:hypothetical protein